jgi:N-methylhydantoinase A
MQFQGQSHILPVPIDSTRDHRRRAARRVRRRVLKRFGVELPEIRPVLVNLHTAVIGRRKAVALRSIAPASPGADLDAARRTTRPVWFEGEGWCDTPVYVRERLPADSRFAGPAIIEQLDCTTVIARATGSRSIRSANLIVSV